MTDDGFTPEQRAELTQIWDRLYELYLQQDQRHPRRRPDRSPKSFC